MLELHDIQGIILRRNRMPCGVYLFFRIDDPAAGRGWLQQLVDPVTSASEWSAATQATLNVAFTHRGLAALGVQQASLESFPEEFRADIAAYSEDLGDIGESSPEYWDGPLGTPAVHVLVILHAVDHPALDAQRRRHAGLLSGVPGVELVHEESVAVLPTGTEHFGYRDGISEPAIQGSGLEPLPGQDRPLKAGEIVLGQPDENDELPVIPLPEILGRNGSYLVFRKLHQKVAEFRAFLAERTANDDGSANPAALELLAAKLVGRWRSGAPLVLAPERDDPALANSERNNDFRYRDQDPRGLRCPKGAHIRRVNPRDALEGEPVDVRRHRFIRRGLPYGPWLPESARTDDVPRGTIFLFIGASISRQFVFVQKVWINDGDFAGLGQDKDPLVGANDGTGRMLIPAVGGYRQVSKLPRFVTIKGGGYFFLPGIKALGFLADAGRGARERRPHPASAAPERPSAAASITDPTGVA